MGTKRTLMAIGDNGKDPPKSIVRQIMRKGRHGLHEGQGLDATVGTWSWHERQSWTGIVSPNMDDGVLVGGLPASAQLLQDRNPDTSVISDLVPDTDPFHG